MSAFEYSINEKKVYNNACLKMFQEAELYCLEAEFKEVLDLLELFGQKENDKKLFMLEKKIQYYILQFKPKIKEAKRSYVNTDKRLKYNLKKC